MPRKRVTLRRSHRPVMDWGTQVGQYKKTGEPGISYYRANLDDCEWVDCLLFRNETGELVGILNHYPQDLPPWEEAGNVNVWVNPQFQRQGIATKLVVEAIARWNIDLEDQMYTVEGRKLYRSLRKGSKNVGQ